MGKMASKQDQWVRCFDVSDPRKHPKGYTVYKVTYKIFSRETTDLVEEIVIWKRYNDFKKLYVIMADWHRKLHRKEDFPVFAKPTVFGRFEEAVIEQRRHASFELLVFLGRQPHLHNHEAFVKFFEGGERQDPNKAFENTCPLEPERVGSPNQDLSTDSFSTSDTGSVQGEILEPTDVPSTQDLISERKSDASLGGVWKYRQSTENISLDSNNGDDDDDDDDEDEDGQIDGTTTALPENDLSLFDPMKEKVPSSNQPNQLSNMWLLSAMSVCAELENKSAQPSPQHFPVSYSRDNINEDETVIRVDITSQTELDHPDSSAQGAESNRGRTLNKTKDSYEKPKLHRTLSEAMENILTKDRSDTAESVTHMDVGGHDDYICQAASQISLAKECEANTNNEMAFRYYKGGVAVLLEGVQNDTNKARREAVRRKTAQYLLKAEDIYNRYLAPEVTDHQRWGAESRLSPSIENDANISHLRGPISELRNYRVLGIISRVMLVLDKTSNETYVMKTIQKSPTLYGQQKANIVPTYVPFMVKLHKFYETESSLFLLLQHATGGKLWNYISAYLQLRREPETGVYFPCDNDRGNIYSGQKVIVSCSPTSIPTSLQLEYTKSLETIKADVTTSSETENNSSQDKSASSNELECSDSYAQFMKEYRKESMTGDINELQVKFSANVDTQGDNDSSDTAELPLDTAKLPTDIAELPSETSSLNNNNAQNGDLVVENCESDSDKLEVIHKSPETGETIVSKHTPVVNRRSSSLSLFDDEAQSPLSLKSNNGHPKFSDVLNGTKSSTGLENFSIHSFDSDHHHSSSDVQENVFNSPLPPLEDDDGDVSDKPVFGETNGNKPRLSFDELLNDIPEKPKVENGLFPSTEELVKNARRLLSSVTETLGEVVDEVVKERKPTPPVDDVFISDSSPEKILDEKDKTGSPKIDVSGFIAAADHPVDVQPASIDDYLENPDKFEVNSSLPSKKSNSDLVSDKFAIKCDSFEDDISKTDLSAGLDSTSLEEVTYNSPTAEGEDVSLTLGSLSPTESITKGQSGDNTKSKRKDFKMQRSLSSDSGSGRVLLQKEPSMDRSLDSCKTNSKQRKRNFSSLFAQLDSTQTASEATVIPENCVRQWAAEIVTCLSMLHSMGIVCRDLRPDNILLGDRGHILLSYFSEWSHVNHPIRPDAIEEYFTAPELQCLGEATPASDWWSFGAILFELLTCKPLASCHPSGFSSHSQLCIPEHVSKEGISLLTELLRFNPNERLGSGVNGSDDIKMHPFFHSINWLGLHVNQ